MEVSQLDLWTLLLSCVRYSMGRRTYMSTYAPELVQRYGADLTWEQIKQIGEEVDFELRINEKHPGHMGMDCDEKSWRNFRDWCLAEAMRRSTK